MPNLDVTEVAMAGFDLIRKRPVSVLVWGLVLIGWIALVLLLFAGGVVHDAVILARDPAAVRVGAVLGLVGRALGMAALLIAGSIILGTVVISAAIRAELEPLTAPLRLMRLSGQELWVLGALLVFGIIEMLLAWLVMTPFAILGFSSLASASALMHSGIFPAQALAGTLWLRLAAQALVPAALLWIFSRLSPGVVMSFRDRRFRLFEGWTLTRGNGMRMFLAMLLVWVMLLVLDIAAGIVGVVVLIATLIFTPGIIHPTAFFARAPMAWIGALLPAVVCLAIMLVVLAGLRVALQWGAAARAFSRLAPADGAEVLA
ncbi:MAG: hypothetical protein ACRED9_01370 [Caulobacteraceae bacterium]